jgi:Spy/CpxP family protein refolding chaperone
MFFSRPVIFIALTVLSLNGSVALAGPISNPDTYSANNQLIAQAPEGDFDASPRRQGQWLQKLNLSAEQRQKISEIRQKYDPRRSQLSETLKTARQELRTMMNGNTPSGELRAKHQEVMKLSDELRNLQFESMLEIRQVLTPEQLGQMAQIMQQQRGNFRQHRRNPQ